MMQALADFWAALTAPTMLPFTIMMIVVMLYWCMVILGALDIEMFDFDVDMDLDGGTEGALEGLDGGADGAAEGLEGGHDAFAGSSEGMLASSLRFLNVGTVPVTVIISVLVLVMFVLAFLIHEFFGGWMIKALPVAIMFAIILTASVVIGLFATGLLTRPLRKLFILHRKFGESHLIGKTCSIRSSQVNDHSGQAEIIQNGDHLILSVRCEGENSLAKGSEAVIVDYKKDVNIYYIKPL